VHRFGDVDRDDFVVTVRSTTQYHQLRYGIISPESSRKNVPFSVIAIGVVAAPTRFQRAARAQDQQQQRDVRTRRSDGIGIGSPHISRVHT